jgi:hypothetical protein
MVVCAYSQSCSPRREADVSHCRTWLMPPRFGEDSLEMRLPHSPKPLARRRAILHEKSWHHRALRHARLFEDLTTCLKDVAQHSIGPTFLVPRIPLSPLSFQGRTVGVTTEGISCSHTTRFLLDFGLRLMFLKLLTTYVNTISLPKRLSLWLQSTCLCFPSPPPSDHRIYPHPRATTV